MVKVDLTKKIVNMSGDIIEHKYFKKTQRMKMEFISTIERRYALLVLLYKMLYLQK